MPLRTNNAATLAWLAKNWRLLVVLIAFIVSYANERYKIGEQQRDLDRLRRRVVKAEEWIDNWERAGQLPEDVQQNALLAALRSDVDDLDEERDRWRAWQLRVEQRLGGLKEP